MIKLFGIIYLVFSISSFAGDLGQIDDVEILQNDLAHELDKEYPENDKLKWGVDRRTASVRLVACKNRLKSIEDDLAQATDEEDIQYLKFILNDMLLGCTTSLKIIEKYNNK